MKRTWTFALALLGSVGALSLSAQGLKAEEAAVSAPPRLAEFEAFAAKKYPDGVVLAVNAEGHVLAAQNETKSFVPASILKVPTGLIGLETLGQDFRFETHFLVDGETLYIQGRGDPLLVSEEIDLLVPKLLELAPGPFKEVVVDDSYSKRETVPGTGSSTESYDSLVTPTMVNFNTVFVNIAGGRVTSAEEQTPLVPLAREVALKSGKSGDVRLNLGRNHDDAARYAGQLIAAKLAAQGVELPSDVRLGRMPEGGLKPTYIHRNSRSLDEVVRLMLEFSNNTIANQIVIQLGVRSEGQPGSLENGTSFVLKELEKRGLADGVVYKEGAGLSRHNRMKATTMVDILQAFEPYRALLKPDHGALTKGGSLSITKTMSGIYPSKSQGDVFFVFGLCGRCWRGRFELIDELGKALKSLPAPAP